MKRFVIMIWHQAGGRDNNSIYYTWTDENSNTYVFSSKQEAKKAWKESGWRDVHVGFIVNCTDIEYL
jgi:hypothetical protein